MNTQQQLKGLKRNTIDKYYTKDNIVELCMKSIMKHIDIQNTDLVVEPSAGNGSFISKIKDITTNYIFYDIEPESNEIVKKDYLLLDTSNINQEYKITHVIGNPPFGRQSSLAIKFIKKSCEYCNTISFILPKSFKKDSMKKHFPENFHLICEMDLPKKSFLVENVEYDVPCVFQIWKKEDFPREIVAKIEPVNFVFVKKTDNPDIAFQRVGGKSGMISKDFIDKSEQSHYFIQFKDRKNIHTIFEKLKTIVYKHENTVGPRSISKQELIREFNKLL
jgi:predicted RNA methylase